MFPKPSKNSSLLSCSAAAAALLTTLPLFLSLGKTPSSTDTNSLTCDAVTTRSMTHPGHRGGSHVSPAATTTCREATARKRQVAPLKHSAHECEIRDILAPLWPPPVPPPISKTRGGGEENNTTASPAELEVFVELRPNLAAACCSRRTARRRALFLQTAAPAATSTAL
jgi:hypothetical protein